MTFMVPEYKFGKWYKVETSAGTEYIPRDLVEEDKPTLEDLEAFLEGEAEQGFEKIEGWGVRLQASGFLDSTEWSVFDTEHEAREYAEDFLGVDPDAEESDEYSGYNDFPSDYDEDNENNNGGLTERDDFEYHLRKGNSTLWD